MFAVVIAFVCFYHAERILSTIAKFLVHLFGGGVKLEKGEVGEESGERRMGGKWKCTQNSP